MRNLCGWRIFQCVLRHSQQHALIWLEQNNRFTGVTYWSEPIK